jgi:CHAT domain-containing protein
MSGFYSARKLGLDKASALTQAMSQVRAQQKWSHPFYWDAFVMMGDWNRISQLGKTP